ncbi:MAG: hypothetical protein V4520_00200 [Bacteroidota bacterium]
MNTMLINSSRPLQYYVIAKRWASDLEFFRLENHFLQKLLDRYLGQLQDQPQFSQLVKAGNELHELEQMVDNDLFARQLKQLELMAEDIIPEDIDALTEVQIKLEQQMSNLTRLFRNVKKEIFKLVLQTPHTELA